MWTQLLGLVADGANPLNPLAKVRAVFLLLAVVLVTGVLGYAAYKTYDAFASKRESAVIIHDQKQEIVRKDGVIADQTQQADAAATGKKAEDHLVLKLDDKIKTNVKQTAEVVTKLDNDYEKIDNNKELTPVEKADQVAKTTIDSVWTKYCTAQPNSAGCEQTSSQPTALTDVEHFTIEDMQPQQTNVDG